MTMDAAVGAYLFVLGLVLGSFYNVVGLRLPRGESVVYPPSSCGSCGMSLRARHLVPVFSYIATCGRCAGCRTKISPLYPAGELATGLMFIWVYGLHGYTEGLLTGLLLVSLSVMVTVADLKYMLIPNKLLLLFLAPLAAAVSLTSELPIWNHALGALAGGAVLLLIVIVSGGGMGMGDVKLFTLLGLVLGLPLVFLALIMACLAGTVIGGALLLTGRIQRKQPVPFGPFLAIGALAAYGYGTAIIEWYITLFM
ncbi:prepilin peptidase [Paenibacillus tarimensis]|uniref:prepilin peptidase n=1 Tax=Paenibacillus tarimensis TaxID=416012 RepID=UPI002E251E2A